MRIEAASGGGYSSTRSVGSTCTPWLRALKEHELGVRVEKDEGMHATGPGSYGALP